MRRSWLQMTSLTGVAVAVLSSSTLCQQPSTPAAWASVEAALGRKGAIQPGNIMRFSFARSDLSVNVGGVTLKPALALGGWVAFKEVVAGQAMAMGDLVLTEDEVGPVMRALQAAGVEQTALHNHVLNETPHVMYMHILAHGDPVRVPRYIHDALATSKTRYNPPCAVTTAVAGAREHH